MIEVAGLTKLYGAFMAVQGLSFTVKPGEIMGLVGPNGAGKTTTLRCLSGVIRPTHGSLKISGHDLASQPLAAKQCLAYFPDEPRLFEYLTVWQHLNFTARLYQVHQYESIAQKLLAELELTDQAHHLPGELSRGMKQKLAIACGLLHSPKVVFFDEPLTGLDPSGIRKMRYTIRCLAQAGASVIISSHLLHLVEEICTHLLILKLGRMLFHGTLDQVRQQFSDSPNDASLEDVFFRATGES
jgi:ABC-2 type transport system ATP-binding protein